ncbi:MAG: hypothetical protein A2504_14005 [Bdellovibrionales bacterium RIFOXYD12_FULL_39_22]|nr:MAG: hypothetical protein A2385_00730 [Bdellovibrionales bacterium RIFOXYB1_FULL_39_21]OFZ43799.1 MAG: hypothetical protein A2485_04800 [Bdellovibrionales bacterium RIFOXYC12_FULL_39_17]OFZ48867.1 MAG: hypothetical protein A2404_18045 [Bdellovibrionales bacterium RIFOXYC1_FULL_39_130]OFZ76600.1 MAG: hypothetical protein A2560_06710 [Bdellovibrionales bacterium RIFOXYD1_FULL_39_84]OFZ94834.1 MAG: hypothetical protein A2504_14005 [Bdellovibrionales bacterium RIFOXYD12_FULL_39_22]
MQKIDLIKWPEQTLACILKEYPLGEIPHYLDTTDLIPENFEMFFQQLLDAINELKIDTRLSYPTYLIRKDFKSDAIPVLNSVDGLPSFFMKRARTLKGAELSLLGKIKILFLKANDRDLKEKVKAIGNIKSHHKNLYSVCKKTLFYDKLYQNLKKSGK